MPARFPNPTHLTTFRKTRRSQLDSIKSHAHKLTAKKSSELVLSHLLSCTPRAQIWQTAVFFLFRVYSEQALLSSIAEKNPLWLVGRVIYSPLPCPPALVCAAQQSASGPHLETSVAIKICEWMLLIEIVSISFQSIVEVYNLDDYFFNRVVLLNTVCG